MATGRPNSPPSELKVSHQTLRVKLKTLWRPSEDLPLIDLGSDLFLIKFQKEENMTKPLHEGRIGLSLITSSLFANGTPNSLLQMPN